MLLLHAGMMKSGSTSLQAAFAAEARIGDRTGYFGPAPGSPSELGFRAASFSRFQRDVRGQKLSSAVRRSYCRMRWNGRPPTSFEDLIISEEMLAHSQGDGHTGRPALWRNIDRVLEAADRPADEVLVVLSLRDADTALPSLYAEGRRHLARRFPTVNDFLTGFLEGRLPAYDERFRPGELRARAQERGLKLELVTLTSGSSPVAIGYSGLLDGAFPWQGRHDLPRLNVRRDTSGWRSDSITAFDRVESYARRLPIRRPPDALYLRLRRTLRRIVVSPEVIVRPNPDLLAEVRRRYPPLSVVDGVVQ